MITMAKLTNPTNRDIALPAGHVIPRGGELTVTNDIIRGDNWPMLSGLINSGAVGVEYDPDPAPEAEKPKAKAKT